jgi:hypothetical protein
VDTITGQPDPAASITWQQAQPTVEPVTPAGETRNRVEVRPDGSLVAVHPDGSTTVLEGPTLPQAAPQPIAATPDQIPDWQPAQINVAPVGAQIGAALGPAVMPSDIPATAANDMRALMIKQRMRGLTPPPPLTPQPTM